MNLTSACSYSKLCLHLHASLPTAHEMEKYTFFLNHLWEHTALPWDACHKPHTFSGDSAVGFVWVESERALSLMVWWVCFVMRCKKPFEFPVDSFNTSGTQICLGFFLSFVVFTGTGTDPSSAVSVRQSFVTPANSHHVEMRSK